MTHSSTPFGGLIRIYREPDEDPTPAPPPLTAASAREVWHSAVRDLIEHDDECDRCCWTLFRCDRGVALARAEGAAWKGLALASVEGTL